MLGIVLNALFACGIGSRVASVEARDAVGGAAKLQSARSRVYGVMTVPWAVMGVGQVVGGVPNIWSFFRPQELNPYVWSWYVTSFLLSCGFAYWVLARDGSKYVLALNLVRVSGFNGEVQVSESGVRIIAVLAPLFTVVWVLLLWLVDIPAVALQ